MNYTRSGNKWTINEILSLQREYELLEMTIQEIALKHSRSVTAILYKLDSEGFIDNWYDANGYNYWIEEYESSVSSGEDDDSCEDDTSVSVEDDDSYEDDDSVEDEIVNLTRRVGYIEHTVNEIKNMVTSFLNSMNNSVSISSSLDV